MDERDVRWYRLRWNIIQPLISWMSNVSFENVEAGFLINDGDLSRFDFKLTRSLLDLQSSILNCTISFSATYGTFCCNADVRYQILLNDVVVSENSHDNCFFSKTSDLTISVPFDSRHLVLTLEPSRLTINVNIRPIGLATIPNYENFDLDANLFKLSDDMAELFKNPYGATAKMVSVPERVLFDVHPFILQYRWNHLCERWGINADKLLINNLKIKVCISPPVLRSILYFMYSGYLPEDYLIREFSFENVEMTRAIRRYHLYNLYKFFVPRCKLIFKETLLNTVEWQYEIDFHYADDVPIVQRVAIPIQRLSETVPCDLTLHVFLRKRERMGRWLSYNIELLNAERLVLELQIHAVGPEPTLLHSRTFDAHIHYNNRSGPIVFMGSRKTFEPFMVDGKLRLLFKILCSDGKTKSITFDKSSDEYNSLGSEYSLTDLSFDMEGVYKTGLQNNCEVIPILTEDRDPLRKFLAHKAIIWARVPRLRNQVETKTALEVEAKEESIRHILIYIYAARFSPRPNETCAHDILSFAKFYNLPLLKNHIRYVMRFLGDIEHIPQEQLHESFYKMHSS